MKLQENLDLTLGFNLSIDFFLIRNTPDLKGLGKHYLRTSSSLAYIFVKLLRET